MKSYIKSKIQFEGIHNWENCPLTEVDFLKYPHRHIFTVIVKKEVTHLDRNIEFIKLGREIQNFINKEYLPCSNDNTALNLKSTSCEMLAEKIFLKFNLESCEVWEDNENAGMVSK